MYSGQINRDVAQLSTVGHSLSCGMTEQEVNSRVQGKLESMGAATPKITHIYRLQFASLWFVFSAGRLQSAQIYYADGLTSLAEGERFNYCR
jgi:hypothetical protein